MLLFLCAFFRVLVGIFWMAVLPFSFKPWGGCMDVCHFVSLYVSKEARKRLPSKQKLTILWFVLS